MAVMRLRRRLARFNRVGTNRVMGLWAPYLPPWAVVVHRGRRSGTTYRTVLLAWRRGDTIVIALTYGETDWLRNVLAAGGGELIRVGRTWAMIDPRIVRSADRATLPTGTRWTARVFGASLVAGLRPVAGQ
jgi:deazaflavin-dependent oxidoreductase (nitroreductase family)